MSSNDAHFSGEGHLIEAVIDGDSNKTIIPLVCDSSGHLLVDTGGTVLGTVKIEDTAGNPITTTAGSLNVNVTSSPSGTQNVLVTNAAGASAVNIQDGGNSITVDGTVAVSNFPATQPVSGTVTVVQPTGTNLHAIIDSGSTTAVTGNVIVVQPTGTNLHVVVDSAPTTAVTLPSDIAPATQNITAQDVSTVTTTGANNQSIYTGTPTAGSVASFAVSTIQSIDIQVTGTWTGTLQIESSLDGGTTWYKNGGHQKGVTFNSSSFTSNFQLSTNVAASTTVRVRAIAAWTGTATVRIVETINSESTYILNAIQLLDGSTTGNKATIKAASTGPAATDTALVVAQSPNLAVTIQTVGITASSNGDNTVIAAVSAKKIYVFAWNLSFSGTVNAKFTDGAGGTLLSGLYYGIVNAGGGNSVTPPSALWIGSTNTALVLNLSGATAVGGSVSYFVI